MSQLQHSLNDYIKVVELFVARKGFDKVKYFGQKGSSVRFELYMQKESVPCSMWVIHTEHDKKRSIWSREDYKKGANRLDVSLEDFMAAFKEV